MEMKRENIGGEIHRKKLAHVENKVEQFIENLRDIFKYSFR